MRCITATVLLAAPTNRLCPAPALPRPAADLAACGNKLVDAQRAEADAKNELGECQADLKSLQSQCDECTKTLATGR